jgi:hypothetical protein
MYIRPPLLARLWLGPRFLHGTCATIVDYILLPSNCPSENPAVCEVVPHDSTDVYGVSSGHSPILLPCLPQPRRTHLHADRTG